MPQPTTRVFRVGDPGVIIPQETLDALGLKEGDQVMAVRGPEGVKFVPCDDTHREAMESARDYMQRHADSMRKLAEE